MDCYCRDIWKHHVRILMGQMAARQTVSDINKSAHQTDKFSQFCLHSFRLVPWNNKISGTGRKGKLMEYLNILHSWLNFAYLHFGKLDSLCLSNMSGAAVSSSMVVTPNRGLNDDGALTAPAARE